MDLQFFASNNGFLVLPVVCNHHRHALHFYTIGRCFCTSPDGRPIGHHSRGRHFRDGHNHQSSAGRRRSPPCQQSPGHWPGPSVPTPRRTPATCDSSERTRTATPPYTEGLVLPGQRHLARLNRTTEEEPPRRPLILRLHHHGSSTTGIRIISDLNSPATMVGGNAGFGPQAGRHPNFIIGTMAARRGAPRFFPIEEPSVPAYTMVESTTEPPVAATPSTAPSPAQILGRIAAVDRRPDIRCGTIGGRLEPRGCARSSSWPRRGRGPSPRHPPRHLEPASLGFSSDH